jgi:hypothetical protein
MLPGRRRVAKTLTMRYQFVIAVNVGIWNVLGAFRRKFSKSIRSKTGQRDFEYGGLAIVCLALHTST